MANGDEMKSVEDYLAEPADAMGLLVALRDQLAEHESDVRLHSATPSAGFPSDEKWRADQTRRQLEIRGELGTLKAGQRESKAEILATVDSLATEMRAGFRALGLNGGMSEEQLSMFDDPR